MQKFEEFLNENQNRLDEKRKISKMEDGSNLIKGLEKRIKKSKEMIDKANKIIDKIEKGKSADAVSKYAIRTGGGLYKDEMTLSVKFDKKVDKEMIEAVTNEITISKDIKMKDTKAAGGFDLSFIIKSL